MAYTVFPSLPGLSWSVFKEPQFKTRIQKGVSGRELRLTFQPVPTWMFKLKFDFLRDKNDLRMAPWGTTFNELREILGLFLAQQGALSPFAFNDPTDNAVTGQAIGTTDGNTATYQLIRTMGVSPYGQFNEPILAPNVVNAIYLNGNVQDPGFYSVNFNNGTFTFSNIPGSGFAITADFTYYFLCRFNDDTISLENFLFQLWALNELKLQSILL